MPVFDLPPVSAAELAAHASPSDCWIAVDGVVADATPVIAEHPGGGALAAACGTDATVAFDTRPMGSGSPHSAMARAALARQAVGWLMEPAPRTRLDAAHRSRARGVGALPAGELTPAHDVDLEVGHAIGAEVNVWVGVSHGVGGWLDLSFGHATWTGESDLALRARAGDDRRSLTVIAGAGYRYQGVPEAQAPGLYAELVGALAPLPWLQLGLVPSLAALPAAADPLHAELGGTLALRPLPLLSVWGEVRGDLFDAGLPQAAGGVRFFTVAHTFTLGVASSPALAPLERLAAPEGGVSVQAGLTRRF